MDAISTTPRQIPSLVPKSSISNNTGNKNKFLIKPPSNPYPPWSAATNSPLINPKTKHRKYFKTISVPHLDNNPAPAASSSTVQTHSKAATGYAAALLDAAYSDVINIGSTLVAVVKEAMMVKRIVNAVLADERIKEEDKGEWVTKVVERGNFYMKLVVLVKMLAAKGKVMAVEEVMDEFVRLWEELCGIERVVFVKEKHKSSSFVIAASK